MTALWAIFAIVIIALLVWVWNKNCTEKAEIAAGVQKLVGRVDALEPAVTAQGNNIYALNNAVSATAQGVKDMKQCFGDDIYQLNEEIFYGRSHSRGRGGCGGCGGSEYKRTQTYNLASTALTVDDTCRN